MFKSMKRVIYPVSDLGEAKNWYKRILMAEPTFDSPMGVAFAVGDVSLVLLPKGGPCDMEHGSIVYWTVDDVVSACRKLYDAGAAPHREMTTMAGMRWASVKDPFGNVVGVISEVNASEKTVELKPSDTARGVAGLRFLATFEPREEIRGRDYLAELFITEEMKATFSDPIKREWFVTKFCPPGMYRGHITRTAWFDRVVEESLRAEIPQVVFLGAGYDSRPYRFAEQLKGTRIFELDAPPTQEHKRSLLDRAGIAIPQQLAYIPTDFARDELKAALFSSGFDKTLKTLYIWEGVTYYLPAAAIDDMLGFIRGNSPAGSVVCFDYYSTFPDMENGYGVKEQSEFMSTHSPGERMQFHIEREQIGGFLADRGFALTEHLLPDEIEKRYLTLKDGTTAGKTNAAFCYARAEVM